MTPTFPNARFWIYWNDTFIKVRLRPGQTLRLHRFARDEEGWSARTETWFHDDTEVATTVHFEGVDCDGRTSETRSFRCVLFDLQREPVNPLWRQRTPRQDLMHPWHLDHTRQRPILNPVWRETSRHRRDYAAEAAGY